MNVIIRSIDKQLFSGTAEEVILPGLLGKIGVRAHHASMSLALSKGDIDVKQRDKKESFECVNGIAHVHNNTLNILLD